jgi:hypothetical protein
MKKLSVLLVTLFVFVFALALVQPAQALPDNPKSMNARMIHWQEEAAVIHILAFSDAGSYGVPAVVEAGQPLLFGVEWGDPLENLQAYYNDPNYDTTVSVDGGSPISLKDFYQAPFISVTQSGPAWSWDHDGDGPGDGDGDGIGDWNQPIMFFRYPYPGMTVGTHTFEFHVSNADLWDTITVEVVP